MLASSYLAAQLELLDPDADPKPLALQIDAAHQLADELAASEVVVWDHMLHLLTTLVPSLMRATQEELVQALVDTLRLAIARSERMHRTDCVAVALQLAEQRVVRAVRCDAHGPSAMLAALVSLLAVVLDGETASAAANELTIRKHLVHALLRGCDVSATPGATALAPSRPSANSNTNLSADLARGCARVLLRLLQCHGASPAEVLLRCGVSIEDLISLLPRRAALTAPPPSAELLELLGESAADPSLAARIADTAMLTALRSHLLSAPPPVQLATIDLFLKLTAAPGAARSLCDADLIPFCLELCRLDHGAGYEARHEARHEACHEAHETLPGAPRPTTSPISRLRPPRCSRSPCSSPWEGCNRAGRRQ